MHFYLPKKNDGEVTITAVTEDGNYKDKMSIYVNNNITEEQLFKGAYIQIYYYNWKPFSDEEINHYKKKLTKDGRPIINPFQKQMIGYLFFKEFGDPVSINTINQTQYIKLLIAAKRLLLNTGMVILPYIISSRVTRVATRKSINKKELIKLESSELYNQVKAKYNNPKIQKISDYCSLDTVNNSLFPVKFAHRL